MATHCQMPAWNRSGECQNLGVSTPLKAKERGCKLQTRNPTRVVTCKMCLFSLYLKKYMTYITGNALWKNWSHFCICGGLQLTKMGGGGGCKRKLKDGQP